jgi:hypothetical protein
MLRARIEDIAGDNFPQTQRKERPEKQIRLRGEHVAESVRAFITVGHRIRRVAATNPIEDEQKGAHSRAS